METSGSFTSRDVKNVNKKILYRIQKKQTILSINQLNQTKKKFVNANVPKSLTRNMNKTNSYGNNVLMKSKSMDSSLNRRLNISCPIASQVIESCWTRFLKNQFDVACSTCDRFQFERDLCHAPDMSISLLREMFPDEDVALFLVCNKCYKTLLNKKIPSLSKSNDFVYFRNINHHSIS